MEVTAEGFDGTFDGDAHGITVNAPEGADITYSEDGNTYNDVSPTYTNVGTYTVYYKVTKDGYNTFTGSAIVTIAMADGTISFETATVNKTFGDAAFTNELFITGDGTVSYASSNENVATVNATTGEVTIVGAGSATITATVANDTNYTYATKTASYTLMVAAATITVTSKGWKGVYDGKEHSISLEGVPENAEVSYGQGSTVYTTNTSPSFKDAGKYVIYYEVTKPNYATVKGCDSVVIEKAPAKLYFGKTGNEMHLKMNEIGSDKVKTEPKDLPVVYSSSDEDIATVEAPYENESEFRVIPNKSGRACITATFEGNTNYKAASASFDVIVEGDAIQPITENQEYSFGNSNDYTNPNGSEKPLNGVVINNIFHNLWIDDATGYDSEEGCIAIGTPTSPENIRGAVEGFASLIIDVFAPYDPNSPEYPEWLASWSGLALLVDAPKEGQIGLFTVESKEEGVCQIAVQPGVGEMQTFQHGERAEDEVIITPEDGRNWQNRLDAMGRGDAWKNLYGGKSSTGTENPVMLVGIFNHVIGGDARSKVTQRSKMSDTNVKVYAITYKVIFLWKV